MKVTYEMIHPDLRTDSRWIKPLLKVNAYTVPLINRLCAKLKGKKIEGLDSEEIYIPRTNEIGSIRVRIYRPKIVERELPVIVFYHGGGYCIMNPETCHGIIKDMIDNNPCIVVVPDYRLSIEKPYPASFDDAFDTLIWVKKNLVSLGGRSDQIFVGGESAGGGLAVAVCLKARDTQKVRIAAAFPLYPMLDSDMNTNSMKDNNAPVLNEKMVKFAWSLYLKSIQAHFFKVPVYASPGQAECFSGLPRMFTFYGSLDPFKDEIETFMKKCRQAKVEVFYKEFEGCFHAFEEVIPKARVSIQARKYFLNCFDFAINNCFAKQL